MTPLPLALCRAALAALVLLAGPAAAQTRADPEAATGRTPKPLATGERHMIVAANPLATEAGLAMLRRGGSAADAAIAALAVLNVVEPQSSGIGGGAFALVHGPDGLASWDARETAPQTATAELFVEDGGALDWPTARASGHSVGTPGLVALMKALHDRHGNLPWAQLFGRAVVLARDGFHVSPRLAGLLARYAPYMAGTDAAEVFMPYGEPLAEGKRLRQPALARTLRRIAEQGPPALYEGPVAEQIVAAVRQEPRPGGLSLEDLAAYRVIEREPVCAPYRSVWEVCGMGPPSSGATTVAQILGILARGPASVDPADPGFWHRFAEASRLAYADRARYLADPDAVDVPVEGLLHHGYLDARASLIKAGEAMAHPAEAGTPPGTGAPFAPATSDTSPGTTHLSVIDADGLAVSLTASIESAFGSGRMAAGMLLNNQLTDFSLSPTDTEGRPIANAPGPGKRPRSSMAPTIVYRGVERARPVILAGSPGGSRIPEYVAGALVRLIDLGRNAAGAAAGFHVSQRNRPETVLEEGAAPPSLAEALEARGHSVSASAMTSGLHIITVSDGGLAGGADPRREGTAAGD